MGSNYPVSYYILRGSSDPAVLGNATGIKQADIKRDGFLNPEEFDRVIKDLGTNHYWKVRDLVPNSKYEIQCVEMMSKSRIIDFLRFGPFLFNCPFMISEKVIQILTQYSTSGVTIFPSKVRKNQNILDYGLLYILPMSYSVIDFGKSIFYTGDILTGKTPRRFANEGELAAALAQKKRVEAGKILMQKNFPVIDFFKILGEIVVSKRLKDHLEDSNATSGANFLPAFGEVPWPTVAVSD